MKPRSIRTVVLLWPSDEDYDRYLPLLLERCPDVAVYVVWKLDTDNPNKNGLIPRTKIDGYEGLMPSNVDLNAEPEEESAISALPSDAMYGTCAEIAKSLRAPRGYSYLATLVMSSVYVKDTDSVRANLYGATLGDVHAGKTVALEHAGQVLNLLGIDGQAASPLCVRHTPASDRGLINLFPGPAADPRVLALDEGRILMSKGSIENSTLISNLCQLWSLNGSGTIDKKGLDKCHVRLSILANIKIKDNSEFSQVFTHATAHGLWDRFLYAVLGDEKWSYDFTWTFDPFHDDVTVNATEPRFTKSVFDLAHAWRGAKDDRQRLTENALRVALVTSAINRDETVTTEAMQSALRLMEWQEQIRARYQPAKGANEMEECVTEIVETFRKTPGRAFNFRAMGLRKNWWRKFARTVTQAKKMLEINGVIGYDKISKKHFLMEEK